MKRIILILLLIPNILNAKHLHSEKYYQNIWCNEKGGQLEYVFSDKTRCDCLLKKEGYATEFDFAKKWYEGVTQSLHYAIQSGLKPGLVLIVESEKELEYVWRAEKVIKEYDLNIRLWVISEY